MYTGHMDPQRFNICVESSVFFSDRVWHKATRGIYIMSTLQSVKHPTQLDRLMKTMKIKNVRFSNNALP